MQIALKVFYLVSALEKLAKIDFHRKWHSSLTLKVNSTVLRALYSVLQVKLYMKMQFLALVVFIYSGKRCYGKKNYWPFAV